MADEVDVNEMRVPPDRAQLKEMADKVARLKVWGQPADTLDELELRGALWVSVQARIDAYNARLSPLLKEVEAIVREIETNGLRVDIVRSEQDGFVTISADVHLPKSE